MRMHNVPLRYSHEFERPWESVYVVSLVPTRRFNWLLTVSETRSQSLFRNGSSRFNPGASVRVGP